MATPSKPFLITGVFVFHYYPSGFDGSIIIVPSSFLKRMLFSSSSSAHYTLKSSCGNPLMNLIEAVKTLSMWEHFQQTVLYNSLISVWRCRDKQMGLFTTTSSTQTTVFMLTENLSCICPRGEIKTKRLREISNLFSKTPSHAVTLLLNYISWVISPFSRLSWFKFCFRHWVLLYICL